MTKWGLDAYERGSRQISSLERFNQSKIIIPEDFENALRRNAKAWSNYQRLPPSNRKRYFLWISSAKRPETRQKRIADAVQLVAKNVRELMK